jgi:hypothetical protein
MSQDREHLKPVDLRKRANLTQRKLAEVERAELLVREQRARAEAEFDSRTQADRLYAAYASLL